MVNGGQKLCNWYEIYELANLIKDSFQKLTSKCTLNITFFGKTRLELTILLQLTPTFMTSRYNTGNYYDKI